MMFSVQGRLGIYLWIIIMIISWPLLASTTSTFKDPIFHVSDLLIKDLILVIKKLAILDIVWRSNIKPVIYNEIPNLGDNKITFWCEINSLVHSVIGKLLFTVCVGSPCTMMSKQIVSKCANHSTVYENSGCQCINHNIKNSGLK